MSVYKDWQFAERILSQMRFYYPEADKLVILDGEDYPRFRRRCERNGVIVEVAPHRMKIKEYGAAASQRNLRFQLRESDADLFIKVDPDSFMWRQFNKIPDADFFSQVHTKNIQLFDPGPLVHPHGGCWGLRRHAMEKIVESELLLDKKYCHRMNCYQRYAPKFSKNGDYHPNRREWIPHEDFPMGDVANKLKIKLSIWKENLLGQKQDIIRPSRKYAVTHPVRSRKWMETDYWFPKKGRYGGHT